MKIYNLATLLRTASSKLWNGFLRIKQFVLEKWKKCRKWLGCFFKCLSDLLEDLLESKLNFLCEKNNRELFCGGTRPGHKEAVSPLTDKEISTFRVKILLGRLSGIKILSNWFW
jgi:hypothetical protein